VDVSSLSGVEGYDLSVKNPDGGEVVVHRSPLDIMEEIAALDAESAEILARIRELLSNEKGA
jgi:type I restriction enzyme M protein